MADIKSVKYHIRAKHYPTEENALKEEGRGGGGIIYSPHIAVFLLKSRNWLNFVCSRENIFINSYPSYSYCTWFFL
jgi:hypothetical protein